MTIDAIMLKEIKAAAIQIQEGELVGFPTETVYGLGADATSDDAVTKIFSTKGRPKFNPLIIHVTSIEEARQYGVFSKVALDIAHHFWPGPLTLILQRTTECSISWLATAGLSTIALRVPDHPIANELIKRADRPIAAPSANRSGKISPTRAEDVIEEFRHKVETVLDGGNCQVGLESTVIDISGSNTVLLRPGYITQYDIENKVGPINKTVNNAKIIAPGMLKSHYAPDCKVRLNASSSKNGELFLGFGENSKNTTLNLSVTGNLNEAASNLFQMLRELDKRGALAIAVAPIPEHGLGIAINDRLKRAAAPR